MTSLNEHIKTYLKYYLNSDFNPEFAVLLQGRWGCGKTWFIKQFIEKYQESNKHTKFIYITLYGVTSIGEIEDQIFQQLHPILSSKVMALSGKLLKGVVKASLKIDLDNDTKLNLDPNLSNINLPDYLKTHLNQCLLLMT